MKTKIYEKNDFKKYFNKNEEFNEPIIPEYIKNSISNTIVPKKSFSIKENLNKKQTFFHHDDNIQSNHLVKSYQSKYFTSNNQTNQSENNCNYDPEKTEWNDRPAAYFNTNGTNNDNNSNENYFGFSKFLKKKNVYDKLTELRESIGKRKINYPYLVLSNHEDDKKEFFYNIISL